LQLGAAVAARAAYLFSADAHQAARIWIDGRAVVSV
jgi:hypothetical protein